MMRPTLLALLASVSTAQHDVWIVDAAGGGDFLDLQPAIDAAAQRDVLLVKSGSYGGFVLNNKSLAIVGDEGEVVYVVGEVVVRNLPPQRDALLSRLRIQADLTVRACDAAVRLENLRVAPPGFPDEYGPTPYSACHAYPTLGLIEGCDDVVLHGCVLVGRTGLDSASQDGQPGESALVLEGSTVQLYGCLLSGGDGGDAGPNGFGCDYWWPGHGGSGLVVWNGSQAFHEDCTFTAGVGGDRDCYDGCAGQELWVDGTSAAFSPTSHAPLGLAADWVVRDGSDLALDLSGAPGTPVALLRGPEPFLRTLPVEVGRLLVSSPLHITVLGALDGNGALATSVPLPPLTAGAQFERYVVQAFGVQSGARFLSGARTVLVIDAGL